MNTFLPMIIAFLPWNTLAFTHALDAPSKPEGRCKLYDKFMRYGLEPSIFPSVSHGERKTAYIGKVNRGGGGPVRLSKSGFNDPRQEPTENSGQNQDEVLVTSRKGGRGGKEETFRFLREGSNSVFYVSSSTRSAKSNLENNSLLRPTKGPSLIPRRLIHTMTSTFLPRGYPHATSPGYLPYSAWSWTQDLSTQLRSVLATQRILEGMGVGRAGATALSASLNYIVRDGAGMAASLLFTSAASGRFGADVKRWRLFADVMNDVGITLEVAATIVPSGLFLWMICAGNVCKAMCGVAAGACGGAINLHWSKGSDIADINAKFGAQHTVTGSLGLVFAAMFAKSVSSAPSAILWTLYASLTILHIYANVRCMKLVAFRHWNTARMNMVVMDFLERILTGRKYSVDDSDTSNDRGKERPPSNKRNVETDISSQDNISQESDDATTREPLASSSTILTPVQVSFFEPVFFSPSLLLLRQKRRQLQQLRRISKLGDHPSKPIPSPPLKVRFGLSFNQLVQLSSKSPEDLLRLLSDENIVQMEKRKERGKQPRRSRVRKHIATLDCGVDGSKHPPTILVCLLSGASPRDKAFAYFHGLLLAHEVYEQWSQTRLITAKNNDSFSDLKTPNTVQSSLFPSSQGSYDKIEKSIFTLLESCFDKFESSAKEAGWEVDETVLHSEGYEMDICASSTSRM